MQRKAIRCCDFHLLRHKVQRHFAEGWRPITEPIKLVAFGHVTFWQVLVR